MKKTTIFLIILFNIAGALILSVFMSPSLFPSIFYSGYKLNNWSLGIRGDGLIGGNWFVPIQLWILLFTFLVSTLFAVLTFVLAFRATKTIFKRLPIIVLLVLFLIGLLLVVWGHLTCSGEGCIGVGYFSAILILVFYCVLQTIVSLLVSKMTLANREYIADVILVTGSILFLIFFGYTTIACGYSTTSRDNCYYSIADNFIRADVCEKINSMSQREGCLSQVRNRAEALRRYKNPQVVFEEGIPRCQAISFDQWPYQKGVGRTDKEACYQQLITEADIRIPMVLYYPCIADSVRTIQEEMKKECFEKNKRDAYGNNPVY